MTRLSAKRKAAMLLVTLDPNTAAQLLQAAGPELATELAAEIASLESSPAEQADARDRTIREFLQTIFAGKSRPKGMVEFKRLLESALGADQSQQIIAKAQRMAAARDPFASIRDIEPPRLVEALANEPPQVVAMVLAELPSARSSEALGLLPETTRPDVIRAMAGGEAASAEVRLRIATAIADRLKQKAAQPGGGVASDAAKTQRLRKVALLLRGQPPEQRQPLIDSLSQQDADAGKLVNELMVTWEDLTHLVDRSLQEALRVVDTRKLAMAMVGCDDKTIDKIRRNISERARASLDEETSLLSSPSDKEVEEGRASLLEALREINAQGTLRFEDA